MDTSQSISIQQTLPINNIDPSDEQLTLPPNIIATSDRRKKQKLPPYGRQLPLKIFDYPIGAISPTSDGPAAVSAGPPLPLPADVGAVTLPGPPEPLSGTVTEPGPSAASVEGVITSPGPCV